MVKPTIAELSNGDKYNRYMLVTMAAKGAKYVTDRENYDKTHSENDSFGYAQEKIEIDYNDKPVKNAINLFYSGEIKIKLPPEAQKASDEHLAACHEAEMDTVE